MAPQPLTAKNVQLLPGTIRTRWAFTSVSASSDSDQGRVMYSCFSCTWLRIFSFMFSIVALYLIYSISQVEFELQDVLEWLSSQGLLGCFCFTGIYIVSTTLLVPGTLLNIGAGILYGLWIGTLLVSLGSAVGSLSAFVLGRTWLRQPVERLALRSARFRAVDKAIESQGWKICLLLRLTPVMPSTFLNYGLAATKIKTSHFVYSSFFGMVPSSALCVYIGTSVRKINDVATGGARPPLIFQILFMSISVLLVAATVWLTLAAKRAMHRALRDTNSPCRELDDIAVVPQSQRTTSTKLPKDPL